MNAVSQAVDHFIGDREIEAAEQRAQEAHAAAERAWQAVECATCQATLAEETANYWAGVARRVALQRGFRVVAS